MPQIRALILTLLVAVSLPAQEAVPVLSISDCLQTTLAQGYDAKILAATLRTAQAIQAEVAAKNGFSVTTSFGYVSSAGLGDPTKADAMLGYSTSTAKGTPPSIFPQVLQGTASISSPTTKISISLNHELDLTDPTKNTTTFNTAGTENSLLLQQASSVSLSINQTIWDGVEGGIPKATEQKSQLALQIQQMTAQTTRNNVILKVRQAFFTMLTAQKNLSVLQAIANQRNDLLNLVKARYNIKQASSIEIKDADINARSAMLDLRNGHNILKTARTRLANIMGISSDSNFTLADPEGRTLTIDTLEKAVSTAIAARPDLRQLMLNHQSSSIDLKLIQAQLSPTVAITGGSTISLNWNTGGIDSNKSAGTLNGGVKLGLPIVDAGLTARQMEEQNARLDSWDSQAQQMMKNIASDVEAAWNNAQVLDERQEVARMSVERADLQYQIVSTQLEIGTATNKDVVNAGVSLANARFAADKAVIDAQLALYQLLNTMGLEE